MTTDQKVLGLNTDRVTNNKFQEFESLLPHALVRIRLGPPIGHRFESNPDQKVLTFDPSLRNTNDLQFGKLMLYHRNVLGNAPAKTSPAGRNSNI